MAISVLAVDDSRTIRELVTMTLRDAGFVPHLAEDGQHGLEILKVTTPDVIITDINMPRLDGFGFIDAVRKDDRFAKVPILVLTTESAPEMKLRARDAGATGWMGA